MYHAIVSSLPGRTSPVLLGAHTAWYLAFKEENKKRIKVRNYGIHPFVLRNPTPTPMVLATPLV